MTELEKQLLEALKDVLKWVDDWCETGPDMDFERIEEQADAAIAAAEAAQAGAQPCWSCKKPVSIAQRADSDGNCPHCNAELDDGWSQPTSAQPAAVPDDARECLLDVVSHHHDFAEAVQRCADIERENGDDEDVGYWKHQADVLDRMKGQAERALAAAPAPAQVERQAPADGGDDALLRLFWRGTEVQSTGAIIGLKEALRRVYQAGSFNIPAPAIDTAQIVEQIAQQWDECEYEASGGNIDIGAAIRAAGARLAAEAKGESDANH